MGLVYDLEVRKDVKGGSPRTPTRTPSRGNSGPQYQQTRVGREQIRDIEREVNVSLKEFFEAQLEALDRRTERTAVDAREALLKAETALERRLDLLNEFRAQAAEESKKYILQPLYDTNHAALTLRVSKIEIAVSRLYGGVVVVGMIGIANLVKLWLAH